MTTPHPRTDPRRDRTMEKLRAATIALAAETGIDAMTIDEVAARAGVAKGTVYYNVRSKDELVRLALVSGVEWLAAQLRETLGESPAPIEAVVTLTSRLVAAVAGNPELARLVLAEAWRPGRPWYAELVAARGRLEGIIADAAARSIAEGSLPASLDPALVATTVLATTLAATLDAVAAGRTSPPEIAVLTDRLVATFTLGRSG